MGLVHQENIFPCDPLPKIAFQPGIGVKHIVVVTDDPVHPVADIQAEFKGTHPVSCPIFQDQLPGNAPLLVDDVKDRLIDPVKMSLGQGAGIRVALRPVHGTQLFLGRQGDCGEIQPPGPQKAKALLGHLAGNGLGSQVEQLVPMALPHSL